MSEAMRGAQAPWGMVACSKAWKERWSARSVLRISASMRLSSSSRLGAWASSAGGGCVSARELVCFIPPSRRAERILRTLEGDPVAAVEATWRLREPGVAFGAPRDAPVLDGETEDGEGVTLAWLISRRELLARRPPLPLGSICVEGPVMVDEDRELEFEDASTKRARTAGL